MRVLGLILLLVGLSGAMMALDSGAEVPEINGSSAASGLAFASGAAMLLRSRRSRQ